jgi:hypothetical protein
MSFYDKPRCTFKVRNIGGRCGHPALAGRDVCGRHTPESIAARAAARKQRADVKAAAARKHAEEFTARLFGRAVKEITRKLDVWMGTLPAAYRRQVLDHISERWGR